MTGRPLDVETIGKSGVTFQDAWLLADEEKTRSEILHKMHAERRDEALAAGQVDTAKLWASTAAAHQRRADVFAVMQTLADRCHDPLVKRRLAELAQAAKDSAADNEVIYDAE